MLVFYLNLMLKVFHCTWWVGALGPLSSFKSNCGSKVDNDRYDVSSNRGGNMNGLMMMDQSFLIHIF